MDYEPVLASSDGIVVEANYDIVSCHTCLYGLEIIIKHDVYGQIYRTRYAHLSALAVQVGQVVKSGQIIGTSGSTGSSTGPHLHFDVSICINEFCIIEDDFKAIDPFGWNPDPVAPVQVDPWAQYSSGAVSWCMWGDGEFVDLCDSNRQSHPIPQPYYGDGYYIDDTVDISSGFIKGYDQTLQCAGVDPVCPMWWESGVGFGFHVYRTIMDGWDGYYETPDNWGKWEAGNYFDGDYEILVYSPSIPGFNNDTFTWRAYFSVVDSSGVPTGKIIDQHIDIGQNYNPRDKWLSLGIYDLDTNSAVYFMDSGEDFSHCPDSVVFNGQHWCRVVIDAVAFIEVHHIIYLPTVMGQ